jgi:hypothetical protein
MCSFLSSAAGEGEGLRLWVWLCVERRRGCEEKGSSESSGGFEFEGCGESGDRLGSKLLALTVLALSFSFSISFPFPFPLSGFLFFLTFSTPLPLPVAVVDFLFPVEPFGRPLALVEVWGRGGLNGLGAIVDGEGGMGFLCVVGLRAIAGFGEGRKVEGVSRRGVETRREILSRFDALHVMIRERRNYEFFKLVRVLREEGNVLGSLFSVC